MRNQRAENAKSLPRFYLVGKEYYKGTSYSSLHLIKMRLQGETLLPDFDSKYELLTTLGDGDTAKVWMCLDRETGERLACKIVKKKRVDEAEIKREIELMTLVSGHPNVVSLRSAYEDSNNIYLVMDLCNGGELFNLIHEKGGLPEALAGRVFYKLVSAVLHCHNLGVIHRDLKLENVLLTGNGMEIKVADFGLSIRCCKEQRVREMVGSPGFMAPELIRKRDYGPEVDVWSAGVILYVLLSGVPPFWGPTPASVLKAVLDGFVSFDHDTWSEISSDAKNLVLGMLCRDVSQRITFSQVLQHPWLLRHTP